MNTLDIGQNLKILEIFDPAKRSALLGNWGFRSGTIYVLNAPVLASDDELNDPFSLSDVRTYLPPHISPRIQVQRSAFTVHGCPGTEYNPPDLTLWFFPQGNSCFEIKRTIDRCGFNRASLYPDLAGLAEYVGWCYKWGSILDT